MSWKRKAKSRDGVKESEREKKINMGERDKMREKKKNPELSNFKFGAIL